MARQNLQLRRGDTNIFTATVTLDDLPVDLSAYDIWCTAKYNIADADVDALFQVTKASGAIVVGGASNNIATVTVSAALTSALTSDVRVEYDIQIKSGAGVISTVAEGTMLITRDITRAT